MKTTIQIENLKCGGCAATISKGLLNIDGVTDVAVDVDASTVHVTSTSALDEQLKDKLSSMGYPEVGANNNLIHKTKSYISCATGKMSS
ncbi:hypothetical protein GCM10011416_10720 [Polaribacter pacificus]|uniref:HMA domain-containing protein n=1 Tax=Polaribacter pacificus TaxID=1775173 RepID=A0A917HWR8_9FLAO|nr:heavy-metal-associated domain-containing protein [Polaribacter pacificus]GGG95114.1 hypothetical protein GCM10011416_10720 [Polaribacter pacificus]